MDKAPDAFRTISEVADDLDLPQHVLRFWETRFAQIKPMKRGGGRRYYRPEDVDVLRGIRHLLYSEGYTIRGVQRIFKDHGVKFVQTVWQAGAPQPAKAPEDTEDVESHAPAQDAGGPERRRLFGILPPLMGNGDAASDHGEPDESAGEAMPPMRAAPVGDRGTHGARVPFGAPGASRTAPEGSLARDGPQLAARDAGLSRDAVRKLQATLTELNECRRLLDAVLEEKAQA